MLNDLTSGSPLKLIIKFALPIFFGNLMQLLFQLSDMVIVGRLIGVDALAAVGSTAPIYFVVLMVAFGFSGGLCIITSQKFGAKKFNEVKKSAYHCHLASFCLSIFSMALMLLFLKDLLHLVQVPENIFDDAYAFMFILTLSLPFVVFYNLLATLIRALGDSKTPLYFLIFSCVMNILLNFIFIACFKMGVTGSALGTFISNIIVVLACYVFVYLKIPLLWYDKKFWKYDSSIMKQHLKLGFPMALHFSILAFGGAIVQTVCNSFGKDIIAGFSIALRIEQMTIGILVALGLSMVTFSAQNWGAKRLARIRKGVRWSLLVSACIAFFGFVLVRYFGRHLISIFMVERNDIVIDVGRQYLLISTPFYLFFGGMLIFRNTIQGLGKPIVPVISSSLELLMRAFIAIIFSKYIGYTAVFWAGPASWIIACLYVAVSYTYTIRNASCQLLQKTS